MWEFRTGISEKEEERGGKKGEEREGRLSRESSRHEGGEAGRGFPPRCGSSTAIKPLSAACSAIMIAIKKSPSFWSRLSSFTHPALGRNTDDTWVVPNSHVLQSLGTGGTLPDTALFPHSSGHLIFINRPTGVQFLWPSKITDECLLTVVTGDELI